MKEHVYEGKIAEEVFNKALEDLKVSETDILFTKEEVKGKLFKSGTVKFHIFLNLDIFTRREFHVSDNQRRSTGGRRIYIHCF